MEGAAPVAVGTAGGVGVGAGERGPLTAAGGGDVGAAGLATLGVGLAAVGMGAGDCALACRGALSLPHHCSQICRGRAGEQMGGEEASLGVRVRFMSIPSCLLPFLPFLATRREVGIATPSLPGATGSTKCAPGGRPRRSRTRHQRLPRRQRSRLRQPAHGMGGAARGGRKQG